MPFLENAMARMMTLPPPAAEERGHGRRAVGGKRSASGPALQLRGGALPALLADAHLQRGAGGAEPPA